MNVYCSHPWEVLPTGQHRCPVCNTLWDQTTTPPAVIIGQTLLPLTPAQIEAAKRLLNPDGSLRSFALKA